MAGENTRTAPTGTGVALTSLGTKISFCWETTAGQMPTTGYEIIYDCTKGLPLGGTPDKLDTTPLIASKFKTSVNGLQELDNTTLECNWTSAVVAMHADWLTTAQTNRPLGKRMWICTQIVGDSNCYYIPTYPASMQVDGLEPNNALKYNINLDVIGDVATAVAPTAYIN